jgi:dihydrofolate reductase
MRKLIMKMSITVDGFVSGPNGESEWVFKTGDEESRAWVAALCAEAGLHVMGRKTFQTMASYWPTATGPIATAMNDIPKAVFTKKGYSALDIPNAGKVPAAASWADARVFNGDLVQGITTLKAGSGKPLLAQGGAIFMRSLIATGLIDEYHLVTHPVVIGAGLPIFSDLATPSYLKLVNVKAFPKGVIVHTYQPA